MAFALSASLLVHALVFQLNFGDQGRGVPGIALPWEQRRVEAPDLRIVLVAPATVPANPPAPPSAQAAAPAEPAPAGQAAAPP
ncbi:MAG: hypothetical protein F9K36_08020, partial [Burkholderiaceae bacterium]